MATFDLQSVLQCLRGVASSFYYKSKLNNFNLTFYKFRTKEVECFFWNEVEAKRGAEEIGTCVWKYLQAINKQATDPTDVVFYSDNCAGQNKNR